MSSPGSGPEETTRHEAEAAFGRLAVALGYVTPEQLRAAEREHASRGSSGERPALGQILLERGSLTGAQYAAVLRSQRAGSTAGAAPGAVPASIGKYLVTGWLGRGGMATVYEAMDPDLRRPVALKVLRPGSGDEPDRLERLRREAAAAARIRHPNLVAVHEVGSAAQADGSIAHYIAMDLVRGSTLADEMDGLSRAEQVRILAVVARATDHAHRAGVVHRDLKPQNVLLERGPGGVLHPYLTDFGLARLGGDEDLTKTGTAVGTPYYMAPEQVRGEHRRMGPATDVWALGVILYEMTVRRKPFAGSSALVVYDQILRQEPVPPARIRRGLPADLLRIAGVAMSKDPASRHASAAEFAEDLERWLAGERVACGRPGWRRVRLRPIALHGGGVVAAAALAIALGLAASRGESPTPTPDAPPPPADPGPVPDEDATRRARALVAEAHALTERSDSTPGLSEATRGEILGEAERLLAGALELDPRLDEAYLARGRTRTLRGDLSGALADAAEAIALAPESSQGHLLAARIHLERYRTLRPRPRVWATISGIQFLPPAPETREEAEIRDLVVEHLQAALVRERGGSSREARLAAGLAAIYRDRYPEAIGHLEAAVAEGGLYHEIHHFLGWACLLAGRIEDAARALTKALELSPRCLDCRERRGLAGLFALKLRLGDGPEADRAAAVAIEDFTAALATRPREPDLLEYRALARHLRALLRTPGRSAAERLELFRGILDDHRTAHEIRPDDPYVLMHLGWAHHDSSGPIAETGGDAIDAMRRAVEAYEAAARLRPDDGFLHVLLGNALADHAGLIAEGGGDGVPGKRRAVRAYSRAIEIVPDDVYARTTRGLARAWIAARLEEGGEYALAHADLAEAIRLSNGTFEWAASECPRVCYEWAMLRLRADEDPEPVWSRAVDEHLRRVQTAPDPWQLDRLARLHLARAQAPGTPPPERRTLLEGARTYWKRLLDLDPAWRETLEPALADIDRALGG